MRATRQLNWAMGAHLSALCLYIGLPLGNLLFPYLIWRWQRNRSDYAAGHALAALNAQITVTAAVLAAGLTAMIFPPMWAVVLTVLTANIIFVGKAADTAKSGRIYRYPLAVPWVRGRTKRTGSGSSPGENDGSVETPCPRGDTG